MKKSSILSAVERSSLRSVHYLLNTMDPKQAQILAQTIVYVYCNLCHQLPDYASLRLQSFLETIVLHSDYEFVAFWCSLVNEQNSLHGTTGNTASLCFDQQNTQTKSGESFICRMYKKLFPEANDPTTRTPVTSPQHDYNGSNKSTEAFAQRSQPVWATTYAERKSKVPLAVSRRMQMMMHSEVPLNLFRATVPEQQQDQVVLFGSISPESFPPTPIRREVHTRQIEFYTSSVLDRANQALEQLTQTQN